MKGKCAILNSVSIYMCAEICLCVFCKKNNYNNNKIYILYDWSLDMIFNSIRLFFK